MDAADDGVVLLIGSGEQLYREYLMEGAAARCPLWLIDGAEPTWQRPFLAGHSVVAPLDGVRPLHDQQGLLAAAEDVARSHHVRGVFTYDELLVIATAQIAARLSLPGPSPQAADRCRDKHQTRRALTAAGLPQPRFELAFSVDDARRAAKAIGYPVVLKPRGMGASVGVVRADSPTGLEAAFAVAERASRFGPADFASGILVEELIDGPEISIDGAVVAGEYRGFCLARKEPGFPPYFEEVGHIVDAEDPLLDDAVLRDVLASGHRALGMHDGITHTEVRFSERGAVIIEVNARLGGDLIPYLGQLATGVDPGRAAVDVALGAKPSLRPSRYGSAGIRFLYPPADCRVLGVTLPEPDLVPGLASAQAMVRPGDTLRLPPRAHVGRYAYVMCTGNDADVCRAQLADAAKLTTLTCTVLNETPPTCERPW